MWPCDRAAEAEKGRLWNAAGHVHVGDDRRTPRGTRLGAAGDGTTALLGLV